VIFLELMLRSNAIYLIAALIPVIYAIRIWPAAKTVARRTTEVLIAVIFTLPVVSLAVSMGAAASGALGGVGDASFKDFGTAIAGAVLLLLAALAPWGMIALMPALEGAVAHAYRQRAAVGGGVRSGVQTAYTGTYLGRLASAGAGHRAAAGGGGAGAGGGGAGAAAAATWGVPVAAAAARAPAQAGQEVASRQGQLSQAVGGAPPTSPPTTPQGGQGRPTAGPPGQPGQPGPRGPASPPNEGGPGTGRRP
jgi:type IV secretion system protein TrbL